MQSIYGQNGTFPSTQQVQNGGFYVSDDDSTLVFQVFTADDSPILGHVTKDKEDNLLITLQPKAHIHLLDHSVNPAQSIDGTIEIRFGSAIPVDGNVSTASDTKTLNILLQDDTGKTISGMLFDVLDKNNPLEQYMVHWGMGLDLVSTFLTLLVCGGYVYIQYNNQLYQTSLVLVVVANTPFFDTNKGRENPHLILL